MEFRGQCHLCPLKVTLLLHLPECAHHPKRHLLHVTEQTLSKTAAQRNRPGISRSSSPSESPLTFVKEGNLPPACRLECCSCWLFRGQRTPHRQDKEGSLLAQENCAKLLERRRVCTHSMSILGKTKQSHQSHRANEQTVDTWCRSRAPGSRARTWTFPAELYHTNTNPLLAF